MKKSSSAWLIGGIICLTTSCTPSYFTGVNFYTPLFFFAFFLFAISIYEMFLRRIVKILDKLKKKKKTPKVDLKSLKLEIDHKKNELSIVEKMLKGKKRFVVKHLQMEKFEYVDLLNRSRKFAATKDLPKTDKMDAEEYIAKLEELISKLDGVTNLARGTLNPSKVY